MIGTRHREMNRSSKEKRNEQVCALFAAVAALARLLAGRPGANDMVEGQVTKVDQSAGKLTIKHGPIRKFDMDGMTMVFRAQDPPC